MGNIRNAWEMFEKNSFWVVGSLCPAAPSEKKNHLCLHDARQRCSEV